MAIKIICLILGGGAGTRLYPLTNQRSKPAVPIGGKYRLIDIPISNCLNSGVKRMFVLSQYNSASLNQHIKNTYHFDMFSRGFVDILAAEQTPDSDKWFQGTADAVRQSMHHLNNHDFDHILILSGDQLYQMDFEELAEYHVAKKADVTIATIPVNAYDAPGFGIMKVNGEGSIEKFIEKPKSDILSDWSSPVAPKLEQDGRVYLASMGIYMFNKNILETLFSDYPDATDFGKEFIPNAIESGMAVSSFAFDGYWTDIGTIHSFFEANIALTDILPQFNLFDNARPIYTRARMLPPAKVFGTWFNQAILSDGAVIHAKKIERSIIGIRARVGYNTEITRTVIMGSDYFERLEKIVKAEETPMGIGNDCFIENAILDKNCRIGHNVVIRGDASLQNDETDTYCIRDGIIVVKKGALIPDGSRIGKI